MQNTAARLVFNLRKYDCITPALVTLHWLPVKYRIEFKTLLIVFKGLHGNAPTYIQEMITPSKSKRYSIRSNEERVLKVPKFKHDTFGYRAFAVYGPLAWNCWPKEIRLCDEIEAFKRNLKTHLFVKFVNESTLAIWFWRIIVKRPRMLSAQFVALYKPCKPKPKSLPFLSHWGRLTHIFVGNRTITGSDNGLSPGRHQTIIWPIGNIVNSNLTKKLQWNFNRNSNIFLQEKAFENVVCETASILPRFQCVNKFNRIFRGI